MLAWTPKSPAIVRDSSSKASGVAEYRFSAARMRPSAESWDDMRAR
jgi:hypothetical protein